MNVMAIVDRIHDRKPRRRHVERIRKLSLRVRKKAALAPDMRRNADGYAADISYAVRDMRGHGNGIGRIKRTVAA